ncbi:hypothetical protein, partial [Burkholderia pseudomallei]|uniref:hypothetical protein n=1 Tax=Burkholderia pseudomallei TaxID=28450 RepID=UPI0019E71F6B
VLRDELKRLWFYRKPACAEKAWGQWFEQAQQSGIAALTCLISSGHFNLGERPRLLQLNNTAA